MAKEGNHFEAFQAPEHGWSIDGNRVAHKCGLTITSHGLQSLVKEHGWRGAERVIIQYLYRRVPARHYRK